LCRSWSPKSSRSFYYKTNSEIVDKHYTHIGDEAQEKAIAAISDSFDTYTISDSEKKLIVNIYG